MSQDPAKRGAAAPPDKPSDQGGIKPVPVIEREDRTASPQDAHDAVGESSVAGEEDPGAAIDVAPRRT
ncbi:MAG: hypothetical protein ABIQ60_07220 [Burkholderiaceae bacterium]